MSWNIVSLISVGVAVIAVGFALWAFFDRSRSFMFSRRFMMEREYLDRLLVERERALRYGLDSRAERPKSDRKSLAEIIEEKKKKFENITSISFHFVDESEVTNFYNDTFKEPTVESLVTEIAGQVTGEVKAGLPRVLESKLGGTDLSKWISTIKLPETSLPGMFARYQREAIKRGEVTLGLEELDIELNELQQFEAAVDTFQTSFGLILDRAPFFMDCALVTSTALLKPS